MTEEKTVDASVLGIVAPIKIKGTINEVQEYLKYQIFVNKLAENDPEDWLAFLTSQEEALDKVQSYLTKALGLSAAQAKKLGGLQQEQLGDLVDQLGDALMGWGTDDSDSEGEDSGK